LASCIGNSVSSCKLFRNLFCVHGIKPINSVEGFSVLQHTMVLSKGLVAVTGASGYIGSWCVKSLVEKGYQARGTVRSLKNPEKVQHLIDMKEIVDLFEADLLVDGSFDECFAGCSAVFHVASPFQLQVEDPQKDLIDPALKGTLNVLESCRRVGVKRVILTSSCVAIVEDESLTNPEKYKDKVWTENDWNTTATLEKNPYSLSKVLAEKAAWEFCEKYEIILTTINPSFVMGPPLSPRGDSTSINMILSLLKGDFIEGGLPNFAYGIVHVRTVAEAHVLALGNKAAENERFLVGGQDAVTCLDFINYLRMDQYFTNRKMASKFAAPVVADPRYDNSKAVKTLGLKFRVPAIAVIKTGQFLLNHGLIKLHDEVEDDEKLSIE
jgi:nucleoside-diphosphate-sugar epimerase